MRKSYSKSRWPKNYCKARDLVEYLPEDAAKSDVLYQASRALKLFADTPEAYIAMASVESLPQSVDLLYQSASKASQWMKQTRDSEAWARFCSLHLIMADNLWSLGKRAESIDYLGEVWQTDEENEFDGAWILLMRQIELGWTDEAEETLARLEDLDADKAWQLAKALLLFASERDSERANAVLKDAARDPENQDVLEYLLGILELSPNADDRSSFYAAYFISASRSVPEAIIWMRNTVDLRVNLQPANFFSRKQVESSLRELPQVQDVWVVHTMKMEEGSIVAIYSDDEDDFVSVTPFEGPPTPANLWEVITEAMLQPSYGEPRRPVSIQVSQKRFAKAWAARCKRLEIECSAEVHDYIDDKLERLRESIRSVEQRLVVTGDLVEEMRQLPVFESTWLVKSYRPPMWISDQATPQRPYLLMVSEQDSGYIMMHDMEESSRGQWVSQAVAKAILGPLGDDIEPHRPEQILVSSDIECPEFELLMDELDIEYRFLDVQDQAFDVVDECVEDMLRQTSSPSMVCISEQSGLSFPLLHELYEVSARFYRAGLWRSVPGDHAVQLSIGNDRTWYAVVIGQLGMHLGLVLYESFEVLQELMQGEGDNSGVFLSFVEAHEYAPLDLWHQEREKWTVAAREAYPLIISVDESHSPRCPNFEEFVMLAVTLKTLPAFVTQPVTGESFEIKCNVLGTQNDVQLQWI